MNLIREVNAMKGFGYLYMYCIIIFFFSSCCKIFQNCEQEDEYGKIGCYAASYNTGKGYGTQVSTTLGNQYYDQKMREEVSIQKAFFNGVNANVWILNEGSIQYKNAYATPDGHILFGYYMFYYTVKQYNELAIAGVLAHEWGHRTQFTMGWNSSNPLMELEADAFSGYYMAIVKQWAWSQIEGYYSNVYALGDYYYNSPNHHGTPQQRLAAAYLGVNTAIEAIQNNRAYSYQELHQIFVNQLSKRVNLEANSEDLNAKATNFDLSELSEYLKEVDLESIALGLSKGEEVSYPKRLSEEEKKYLSLFNVHSNF